MARTHEALLKAEKDSRKNYLEPVRQPEKAYFPATLREELVGPTPEWCKEIKARLDSQPADVKIKSIMFTGTKPGSGCSRTAAGFAISLAEAFKHRVLLVDINLGDPGIHKFFENSGTYGLFDVFQNNPSAIDKKSRERLYVITCNGDHPEEAEDFLGSDRFEAFLKKMREEFNYLILDGPPVIKSPEIRFIVSNVDGVILMLESEKAQQKVALKVKQKIETARGRFLGVVINRRKYYIPNWIYRRL
jgi:Mrp family chromosome partitioning ATPase